MISEIYNFVFLLSVDTENSATRTVIFLLKIKKYSNRLECICAEIKILSLHVEALTSFAFG